MSNEMEAKELGVAQHIRNAAPDGCMCEPCIAAREAFGVETSKPADLLEGSKSESVHKFLWNWAHSRGISTDMDGDCTTERWLEIICERFKSAAHISEVERVTKERDDYKRDFVGMSNDASRLADKLEAAESKLSQLQLANEEKARKIEKMVNNAADDFHQRDWHDEILAILSGGQS